MIALYVLAIAAGLALVGIGCRWWGTRPTPGRLAIGFCGALAATLFWMALTVILSREGNASRLPWLLLVGLWAVLAAVRPVPRAALLGTVLFAGTVFLGFLHMSLANSARFTDNPPARLSSVRSARRSAGRWGRPLPPEVTIRPEWHTWLTGLHGVKFRTPHAHVRFPT